MEARAKYPYSTDKLCRQLHHGRSHTALLYSLVQILVHQPERKGHMVRPEG